MRNSQGYMIGPADGPPQPAWQSTFPLDSLVPGLAMNSHPIASTLSSHHHLQPAKEQIHPTTT